MKSPEIDCGWDDCTPQKANKGSLSSAPRGAVLVTHDPSIGRRQKSRFTVDFYASSIVQWLTLSREPLAGLRLFFIVGLGSMLRLC